MSDMSTQRHYEREFVRTFFTSPTAVEEEDDTARMLRGAAGLRGMQAPDVWVPDNEDATAPSMRDEGAQNIVEVVSENGADFPGEIHPRVVWHREDPATRYQGFKHMLEIADPENGAVEYIDGFVIPEVGDIDDWKKADEFFTIVENEHGLEEGSLSMSVIIESGAAELAMGDLREEMGKPSNNLERLFMLVDGEVDYTKDMRAMTPTGELPPWPELRHNTSRGAAAAGLVAVDGPYDDIRNIEGYEERMTENRAKGMTGIWSLTPGQVVAANTAPLPPESGSWLIEVGDREIELEDEGERQVYDGDDVEIEETDGGYVLAEAGNRVVRAVMAGAITGETSFEPVELDVACPFCGAPTEAHHRTELLDVSCTECEGMLGGEAVPEGSLLLQVVPPAGVTGRTPEAAARAALQYVYLRVQATVEGVCPECAGTVSGSLTVCEDHDASDGLCPACDSRYAAWPRRTCDNCKFSTIYPVWFRALSHPEVAALCRRHEVDPGPALSWETWAALTPVGTRVAATDPLAVEVTLSLGDESVTATLDRSMDVVDASG